MSKDGISLQAEQQNQLGRQTDIASGRPLNLKLPVARGDQKEIRMRIVIEHPVTRVLHSLQQDDQPLDPKLSEADEPLSFEFRLRLAPGPKFFGKQVQREGPMRRFIYVRVGQLAGDCMSTCSRRMKIDIHDIDQLLLDHAMLGEGIIELVVDGTGPDGTPSCATVPKRTTRLVPA